jgi:outer membrane protein TolC
VRDLRNNLQDPPLGVIVTNAPRSEFQTFAGISLTQPVLKNAWFSATLANIRLAALASDLAFQEYRRQMMLVISTAEAAYWNLYLAQEQVRFFRESVALAEELVRDNEARFQTGKGSDLEVLEARAGLALRKSKLAEADQKYFETTAQMLTLVSQSAREPAPVLRAVDPPGDWKPPPRFLESGQAALESNPDYLSQVQRLKQENVRVAYAWNQLLPELDLKASYGLNGLGPDIGSSLDDVQNRGFPSFSAGVELHIPLGGGVKSRNELSAAKLRKGQALITLKETETQILNTIESTLRKIRSFHDAIDNYGEIVTFNRNLLDTELDRLNVGKVGTRRVLEVEVGLFEARNSVVEAQVQYERAWLELELVQGTILRTRNLDLPQKEIEERLKTLFTHSGLSEAQYRGLLTDLRLTYEKGSPALPQPMSEEDYQKALRLLRQTIENTEKIKPPR